MLVSLETTARWHALSSSARSIFVFAVLIVCWAVGRGGPSFSWTTIAIVAFFVPTFALLLCPLGRIADAIARRLRIQESTVQFENIVQEIAIALNQPASSIKIQESPIPNVAMLPCSQQHIVVATTGALQELSRYELQALVAAQFAGMQDKWCRLATRAEILWWVLPWICPLTYLALSLDRPFAIIASFLTVFVYVFTPRWNEQARDLCADVAAVRTTFDPQSLGNAMRKLAEKADEASRIKFTSWYLPGNPFLVIPKRLQASTTVNGANSRSWTSADEVRLEFLLRADRAEALTNGADPKEYTGREFQRRWKQLGTENSES